MKIDMGGHGFASTYKMPEIIVMTFKENEINKIK